MILTTLESFYIQWVDWRPDGALPPRDPNDEDEEDEEDDEDEEPPVVREPDEE